MVSKAQAFPSRFFKAADLPREGLVLQIAKIEREKVGPDQEYKWVMYFKGQDKQFVLNGTNWDLIAAALREDDSDGKTIELYATKTQFGSKLVDCIRVRRHRPGPEAAPVPPPKSLPGNGGDLNDEVPF
jgi:hypothetical protein